MAGADKLNETLRVLNRNGEWTGRVESRQTIHAKRLFYANAKVWILDMSTKSVLLQKRSINKLNNPGKWALTGGHIYRHDTPMQTAISEVIEELGIKINDANFKFVMILPPLNGHSFSYQFVYLADKKISKFNLQKEEVDTVEYFKFSDLKNDMKKHERDYAMNYARYEPMLLEIEKIFKN